MGPPQSVGADYPRREVSSVRRFRPTIPNPTRTPPTTNKPVESGISGPNPLSGGVSLTVAGLAMVAGAGVERDACAAPVEREIETTTIATIFAVLDAVLVGFPASTKSPVLI